MTNVVNKIYHSRHVSLETAINSVPSSASPLFAFVPAGHHASVLENLDWLDEPRVYECGLINDMPEGIRLPALRGIDRSRDDRMVLWLEDVDDVGGPWTLDRYR